MELKERVNLISTPNYIEHEKEVLDSINLSIGMLKKKIATFRPNGNDERVALNAAMQLLIRKKAEFEREIVKKEKELYMQQTLSVENANKLKYLYEMYERMVIVADNYHIMLPSSIALPQSVVGKVNEINLLAKSYKSESNSIKSLESKYTNALLEMENKKRGLVEMLIQLQKQLSLYDMYISD